MTFVTTYALILPAITVEKEAADDVAGMYLEEAVDPVVHQDDIPDEDALIPVSVQIAADKDNAVSFLYEDEEMSAVAFFASDEEIPEGAELVVNPVDQESEMYADLGGRAAKLLARESVSEIKTCAFYDFALLCDGVDVTPKSGLADIRIHFYNNSVEHFDDVIYGGKFGLKRESEEEKEPAEAEEGLVMVSADQQADYGTYETVAAEDEEKSVIEEEYVGAVELPKDQTDFEEKIGDGEEAVSSGEETEVDGDESAPVPEDIEDSIQGDELIIENSDRSPVAELSDGIITSLSIKGLDLAENDSVAGLLAGTAPQDTSDENSVEPLTEETLPAGNQLVLTAAGADYTVKVTCDVESGVPKDASLEVSEIKEDSKEYRKYLEETKKAMGLTEEENLPRFAARFFDIKIMSGGAEVTPEYGVTVEIAYTEQLAEEKGMEVNALHFADGSSEPDVLDANVTEISKDGTSNVEFSAESFSVYGVVYTVDFHYEANGKTYDFSIPGGGFISLEHLVEVLGISESDDDEANTDKDDDKATLEEAAVYRNALKLNEVEVSEVTKAFVADVESVVFSSPELVWVGKAAKNTTIGKLKKANNLDCQNSAELTEEQLAEIDAQAVEAGDWALISVLPFSSKESLTITMKNGDVWTIQVTDAAVGNELDGKVFTIESTANNLVMTADDGSLNAGSLNALTILGNDTQQFEFEHLSMYYGDVYRLKSIAQNKYLHVNREGNIIFVDATDNVNRPTEFWIDNENNEYQFSTNLPPTYNTRVYLNTTNVNGEIRYKTGTDSSQRFTLKEAGSKVEPGDWLIFLDEELSDIYVHVGDTITLRPYDKWTWKDGNVTNAAYRWTFSDSQAPNDWNYYNNDQNELRTANWPADNGVFTFDRHIKVDDQLDTKYWSVQGKAVKAGTYVLTSNYPDGHPITVHVLPATDESHGLGYVNGIGRIKVNLFDYDQAGNLDPLNNSNVEGTVVNDAINRSPNGTLRPLHFLSSGTQNASSSGGANKYTKDTSNPNIVQPKLDANGYPVLTYKGQNGNQTYSLEYLFTTDPDRLATLNGSAKEIDGRIWYGGNDSAAITAYPDVPGLFQLDTDGYYFYNSNNNYAWYNPAENNIRLYEHTYTQCRTQNNHTAGKFNSKPIGFFPFHDYNSQEDLWVNQNHNLNHHLGLSMELTFALPSGKVTKDGKPITFEFTGDDDMWVFVDDDLALDMGGIHQPIYGNIDFTNDDRFEAGREYTLRVFYLERGGCDSNCAIRFNMPLTIGTADVKVVKHDKELKTPLPGAEFAIWENEDCEGEPLRRETSGPDGKIHFESLPIFEVGQVYYMKETKAPGSHFLDSTVYKLTAERIGQTDNFRFVITVNKPGADPLATTDESDPLPIIDNTLAEPIDLTIHKEWQNTDGTEHVPDGASATFKIKRWMTYYQRNEEPAYQVKLVNADNNTVLSTYWAYEGDTLKIEYKHSQGSHNPWCGTRNGSQDVVQFFSNGTESYYTVNTAHANSGTNVIEILIPNGFVEWCARPNNNWNGSNPHFTDGGYTSDPGTRITQGDSVHILDDEYNDSATEGIVTLPYGTEDVWTRTIEDLPTTEEREIDGKRYTCYYDYFIVETESAPSGYETIYVDAHNNIIPSSKVQDTAVHEDTSQTVINRKLINIPVEKRWPDYEHQGYTWEAVLHMDFREVPLDGSAPTVWAPYHEGEDDEDDYIITLGNTEGHSLSGQFQNLPMYVTRNDGKVCRREYSVVEQSYIVWESVPTSGNPSGKRVVASFDGTTYYPDENHKYALWYQHDAGEDNNYGDSNYPGEEDYNIMVYNMHENRTTKKDIGLTINKIWKDADGQVISEIPNSYKTKFVLRRNVIVEYRNYENETTLRDDWVWVKLVAGEHVQMLQVPPGTQMYIRGNLIKGRDPGLIVLRDSNNAEFAAIKDDDPGFDAYNLFKASFNAPTEGYTSESNPFVVTCIAGDQHAVGGDDGFLLSDSSDRQIIGLDSTFSKEFELSNENDWTKVFPKTGSGEVSDDPQEQFENEHPLPAIEVSTLDESGNTANTYIYTYFFEEVSCTPDSFYATYTDSSNNIIGDISQPIHSDETITATNRPIIFNILKIDKDDNNKKLPGAEFEFRKLSGNPPTAAAGGTFGTDASFGTLELPSTDANGVITISGNPEGSGLKAGYYEVKETKPPIGHILSKDIIIYLKVEENGDIKLMEKADADGGGIVLVDGGNTTADGYVTLSSASGINGRTITFKVENESGAELPHTGGSGTMLFYLLGGMLTLAAGLLLMRRRTI